MGKKSKREEKDKIAAAKSKGKGKAKGKGKGKELQAAKKGAFNKLESKQKDSQKQWETLRRESMDLAIKYQGIESRAVGLLEHVSQLQSESREIKAGLAVEIEKSTQVRDRLESIEMQEKVGLDELSALNQRLEDQASLIGEVKGRLGAVEQLASKGGHLGKQIEQLQAGKQEMEGRVRQLITSDSGFVGLTSRLDAAIQRLQESEEHNQIIATQMENLHQADADFSQQLGQQQERIQGLMERAVKLDQTAREETESYQSLREQVRDRLESIEKQEKVGLDELSALNQRLEDQASLIGEVKGRLGAVEQLASKGGHLGEQIEQLQAGKQEMEGRVRQLITSDSGVVGLTSRLDAAIQRLQESEEHNQVITTQMENLHQANADFSQQLDQQQERIQRLMKRAVKLDQTAHEETESYQSLREQFQDRLESIEMQEKVGLDELSTLNQRLEDQVRLTNEVKGRLGAVEQLTSKGGHLGEQIEQLQAGKQELEGRVRKLITSDSGFAGLTNRLDAAIQRLQESEEHNQVIETRMENLYQADADFSQQLDQQQERIQELMERAVKLDQTAREETESYQSLREQVRDLGTRLVSTEKHLLDSDAELEKKAQYLDSQYSSLAARHSRLTGGVLLTAVLILILGGVGYWFKINQLGLGSGDSSLQIAQVSERIEQQERRLAAQEQRFSGLPEDGAVSGSLDAWLEQFGQNQAAVHEKLKEFAQGQERISAKVIQIGEEQDEMRRDQEKAEGLFAERGVVAEDGADRNGAVPGNWAAWLEQFSHSQATMHSRLKEFAQGQEKIAVKLIQMGEEQDEMRRDLEKSENLFSELAAKQAEKADAAHTGGDVRNSDWLQGLNPEHYTIQIAAAYDKALLSRKAARAGLRETMAIYKGELRQRDWYRLLYGDFLTAREARAALKGLPESILADGPWIRNISSVHSDLAK